jgi:regulator of replication initiation timing
MNCEKDIGKGDKNVLGFLMVENKRLKEENEDLREMIKMNNV